MKKSILITISATIICSFTAFSFINHKEVTPTNAAICNYEVDTIKKNSVDKLSSLDEFISSGEMYFYINNNSRSNISKQDLKDAAFINDIDSNFPLSWISNYVSVEMTVSNQNTKRTAIGTSNLFTLEQKELLVSTVASDEVFIRVNHKMENAATGEMEDRHIDLNLTIVPEVEAEYINGNKELTDYLKVKSTERIPLDNRRLSKPMSVKFIVDKKGHVVEVRIIESSGNQNFDDVIVDLVNEMPNWNAAENGKGIKVEQEINITINQGGC